MKKKYLFVALFIFAIVFTFGCSSSDNPKTSFQKYVDAWTKKDYKTMYSLLSPSSKKSISEKDFINKYTNIYDGIEVSKLSINANYPKSFNKDSNGNTDIPFDVTMDTAAGKIKFNDTAYFSKDTTNSSDPWSLNWTVKMIYPDLNTGDKIRIDKTFGNRGEIKGVNGSYLAQNGFIESVGIVPGNLGADATNSKKQVATILKIDPSAIDKMLSASYVLPDMFIPITNLSMDDSRLSQLSSIPGVMLKKTPARVYPLKEKAALLTGYVQPINADQLKKLSEQGYSKDDVIGQCGLEKIYENQLKATDGAEIYITNKEGMKLKTIANTTAKNGKDINLTIDTNLQGALYDEYKADSGTAVAMQPKTGAVLALVSAPGYDPNNFVLGMSTAEWNSLQSDPNKPFLNRFQTTFAPGSTFKPITAAIGLKTGKLDPNADKKISGLTWQKDSSWGSYYVTRDAAYNSPANLLNALVHSDNIYFAKTALDIGKDNFINETKNFGIGEALPFEYGLQASKISPDNSINDDIQLADSGYGQAKVLMNPVQLASIYTSFVNGGNIIAPYLNSDTGTASKVLKANVFSQDICNTIFSDLTQVVANPEGTGYKAYMPDLPLAGKTGTAEIKKSQNDTTGTENGWFIAINTNNPKLLVLEMYENVKNKGGSQYVVPNVKSIFKQFCN
jgi:cell division protein FtsI/penicillin-binding protein 2